MEKKSLITVKELAYLLGYNVITVQKLARSGKIKGVKVGKKWFFNKEEIFNKDIRQR